MYILPLYLIMLLYKINFYDAIKKPFNILIFIEKMVLHDLVSFHCTQVVLK